MSANTTDTKDLQNLTRKQLLELERTVDSIRDRFGGRSITSGSTLYMDGKLSAKRIGFGSTEFACRNG